MTRRRFKYLQNGWKIFLRDETAQATTEYILLLTIAMSFALLVLNTFIKPAYQKLEKQLSERLDRALGGKAHCFPILKKC